MSNIKLRSQAGGSIALTVDPTLATDEVVMAQNAIGVNQTWQEMTASRAVNTDYINDTGRPIQVIVSLSEGSNSTYIQANLMVDGLGVSNIKRAKSSYSLIEVQAIVPSGSTYRVSNVTNRGVLSAWFELRGTL